MSWNKVYQNSLNNNINKSSKIPEKNSRLKKEFASGEGFLFQGKFYKLFLVENQDTPLIFNNAFYLSKKFITTAQEVFINWYKNQALVIINERVDWYAKKRNFKYNKIKITNAFKRLGSCSPKGNLNFSWRLIMTPIFVIDYIVVHELVHLVEKNHSRNFWVMVKLLFPDYEKSIKWLKENGHLLVI